MKSQTAEELATYLFDESFKVDLEANVYPTPADELKGEVLNLFTKKFLDKLFSVQYNGLSNKDNKKLRKWNTILFVGFLSQVQTIGGVTVYLCEGGPSRAFDSDICYQGDNKSGAIWGWYSSLLFGKGTGRLSGFQNLKKELFCSYCGQVKDVFKYLNYK